MHKRIVKLVYVFQIRLHTVLLLPNAIKKRKNRSAGRKLSKIRI